MPLGVVGRLRESRDGVATGLVGVTDSLDRAEVEGVLVCWGVDSE